MRKLLKNFTFAIILVATVIAMTVSVMASSEVFDQMKDLYASPEAQAAQTSMLQFLSGPLMLFFRILFIAGILIACVMMVWALKKTWNMFRGNDKGWNWREDIKNIIIGVVIISLLMGGGWLGMLKIAQQYGIDPLTRIITTPANQK